MEVIWNMKIRYVIGYILGAALMAGIMILILNKIFL
jgi:nitrate reductase gamma subunit